MTNTMKSIFWIGIALLIIFGGIAYCSAGLYKEYKNFPAYAEKEVVYEKYASYLSSIDEKAASSHSRLSLAASLESMSHLEELIYLALSEDNPDETAFDDEVFTNILDKRSESGSSKRILKNGVGYGLPGGVNIIIIEHSVDTDYTEKVVVYLKDEQAK